MSENQPQQPDSGMTFDSAPVKQDTPVDTGMTFDSAPVSEDTLAEKVIGASPEEQAFVKANPDHVYLPADSKFPNRPAGVYPTGKGNEWRNDPSYSQSPIDLHLLRHSIETGVGSAAATAGGALIPAGTAAFPDVLPHTIAGVTAIGQWANKNPMTAYMIYNTLRELIPGVKKAIGFVKAAPVGE